MTPAPATNVPQVSDDPDFVPPSGSGQLDAESERTEDKWGAVPDPNYKPPPAPPRSADPSPPDPPVVSIGTAGLDLALEQAHDEAERRPR